MKSQAVKNLECEFSDTILPYLYGEASAPESERFDSHLLNCTACTDEFAELSLSRYSVFEWQKEEFVPLPTPQFVIPYTAKQTVPTGFFEGLRQVLSINWSGAAAASAALAVFIMLGFVAVSYFGNAESQLAGVDESNRNVPAVTPDSSPLIPMVQPTDDIVVSARKVDSERRAISIKAFPVSRRPKQKRTANNNNTPRLGDNEAVRLSTRQDRRSPSLTVDLDDDDRSLRLTDLFQNVDTRL